MDDRELLQRLYRHTVETGTVPDRVLLSDWVGAEAVDEVLAGFAARHELVLDPDGDVRMALPFSAVPTPFVVQGPDVAWYANCAWDAIAVPVAVGCDVTIDATWMDTGAPVGLSIERGEPNHLDGFVHFVVPAARWWDDMIET